ncbi:MAG TPA: NAD(P)H-dependent oxidoreductase [Candidatus Dormibacteraeota bacterium]|jgi:NAD(P)H-dependent FMN reductase|nr:NAD(P)H-dependent oxidoreductase [Candidatus Dormibacteraeota bacterium]
MSEAAISVAVILGSTRPNRRGEPVARWVLERAALRADLEAELIDLAAIDLPMFDEPAPPITGDYAHEHTRAWAATIARHDAFVFVTPEYNRSIPAVLKNAIDFLYGEWNDKAAGFVSYGADAGGARAIEHLRVVLGELRVAGVRTVVPLSLAHDFEDFTRFTPGSRSVAKADEMLTQLASWGRAMRAVRREQAALI